MPLDPTTLNPARVQEEIIRLVNLLGEATQLAAKRSRASAEADVAFRGAWAVAIGKADGTVQEREAQASLASQGEWSAKRNAEAVLWAATEAGRNIRAQLDALRSVNSNLRPLVEA